MVRKPLPPDFRTTAFNAAEIIVGLAEEFGTSPRTFIDLDLQALYDIVFKFAPLGDQDRLQHLVVVDDETSDRLKRLVRETVDRLRPKNRGTAHDVGVTSRSAAMRKLDHGSGPDPSLTQLEADLWARSGETALVLEDDDAEAFCRRMNRIISSRPHGRSRSLD